MSLVLIIEDEPATAAPVKEALEIEGIRADIAGSGTKGVELFRERAYDLILLDLKLSRCSRLLDLSFSRLFYHRRGGLGSPSFGFCGGKSEFFRKTHWQGRTMCAPAAVLKKHRGASRLPGCGYRTVIPPRSRRSPGGRIRRSCGGRRC